MKALALIFALGFAATSFAATANATLIADGNFLPTQCAEQKYTGNSEGTLQIHDICVGQIAGVPLHAIAFRMVDGSEKVFRVTDINNLLIALRAGATKSIFFLEGQSGEQAAMKVIRASNGEIQSVSGQLEGLGYYATEFEPLVPRAGI